MDAVTADALLQRAETAAATMVANLLALDENPTFTLVRFTTFEGTTASRHGRALADAPLLWERATVFRAAVAEARRHRGSDRRPDAAQLAEVARLLTAPVVVDPAIAPGTGLTGRTLFRGDTAAGVRLDDLAATLDTHYRAVTEAVHAIDAVWRTLLPSLQALAARAAATQRRAAALELPPTHRVGAAAGDLAARVRAAQAAATTDPIGQTDAATALAAELDALDTRLDELTRQRARIADELAAARQELVALRLLVTAGARAHERAVSRVREPAGLRAPIDEAELDGPDGLAASLDDLDTAAATATGRPWTERWAAIERWTERAGARRAEAEAVVHANEAPVAARDELRGRLESYRAMAGAHGGAEDTELQALHERAHAALHSAPADLRAAAPLVVAYVGAVRRRVETVGRKGSR